MLDIVKKIKDKCFQTIPPPLVCGASYMIKEFAREEEKILRLQTKNLKPVSKTSRPKLDMASILSEYVSRDLNKDAYKFIKLNPNLNYSEA